jgi:hypothetical protein
MRKFTFTLLLVVLCLLDSFGQNITLGSLSTNSLCGGATNFTISYSLSGTFVSNQVKVELSDKNGSFANPQLLTTSSSNPISVSIPQSNPSGINYKIRLVTVSPIVQSAESAAITFSKISSLNIYNTQNDDITFNELNIMCTGRVLTITTALTDTSGMTFQWKKDGVNILQSGTYSKYRLSSQARYTVSATQGTCPTVNSPYGPYVYYYNTINWSTVVVVNGSSNQCNGNTIGLFAAAYTDSVTYQWYKDNTLIPGATSRNYTASQSGVYKYIGLDGGCNYNGSTSPLTIVPPTTISVKDTLGSGTRNVCTGASVKLFTSVIGGNNTSIIYSWKRNNVDIVGANSSTYLANQSGIYNAIATQSNCVTNSSTYSLNQTSTINNPTISFTDSVKCTGQTIGLSSNNYFSNSAIFQWKKNNLNISGANSINYVASSTGNYKLSITDNSCSAESSPVSLRIGGFQQSVKTSSWTDISTWSCGSLPNATDEVIINSGHTVNIPDNYSSIIKSLTLRGILIHGLNSSINF